MPGSAAPSPSRVPHSSDESVHAALPLAVADDDRAPRRCRTPGRRPTTPPPRRASSEPAPTVTERAVGLALDAEVLLQQGGDVGRVAGRPRVLERAADARGRLTRQHGGRDPRLGLVLGVRLTGRRALHLLRGLGDVQVGVAVDLDEARRRTCSSSTRGRGSAPRCPSPATGAAGTGRASRGRRTRTLRTLDSCMAVAMAIVAARGGRSRRSAIAVIAAALLAWSGAQPKVVPDAVTRHCSRDTSERRCRTPR